MGDVQPAAKNADVTKSNRLADHRTTAVVLVLAAITVVGVGLWAERQLGKQVQRHVRDELQALLRASTSSLELWLTSKEAKAERVAGRRR